MSGIGKDYTARSNVSDKQSSLVYSALCVFHLFIPLLFNFDAPFRRCNPLRLFILHDLRSNGHFEKCERQMANMLALEVSLHPDELCARFCGWNLLKTSELRGKSVGNVLPRRSRGLGAHDFSLNPGSFDQTSGCHLCVRPHL